MSPSEATTMTTANSTLRRELEEARQRAGDAEERAAAAERQCNWNRVRLEDLTRERDMLHEKLESLTAVCSDGTFVRADIVYTRGFRDGRDGERAHTIEARSVVKDLVDALFLDDKPRLEAIEAAREKLREWRMS